MCGFLFCSSTIFLAEILLRFSSGVLNGAIFFLNKRTTTVYLFTILFFFYCNSKNRKEMFIQYYLTSFLDVLFKTFLGLKAFEIFKFF